MLEEYVYKDHKRLRCGYTTGSCAAAAAKAAVRMLLRQEECRTVSLNTPKGVRLELDVLEPRFSAKEASCAVKKDSGDDPDITNGVRVYARASLTAQGIAIDGGLGVGRVTKPGLDQPVGQAAINTIPRKMIADAVREACEESGYGGGISICISVPQGAELAKKTFNPRLGIEGGLSILGTSGIVEPMSDAALVDTIRAEMRLLRASGKEDLLITPGNYGEDFARETLGLNGLLPVRCSNFIGDALDMAAELGFKRVLLVGHIGKLVKLGAGVMNTHSRWADARMEVLAACALEADCPAGIAKALLRCGTTDEAAELLQTAGCLEGVMDRLMIRIDYYLSWRSGGDFEAGAVIFSNRQGLLGETPSAETIRKTMLQIQTQLRKG